MRIIIFCRVLVAVGKKKHPLLALLIGMGSWHWFVCLQVARYPATYHMYMQDTGIRYMQGNFFFSILCIVVTNNNNY